MTDKITKILIKSPQKDREKILEILKNLKNGTLENADVKKISGEKELYRLRYGSYRIFFQKKWGEIKVVDVRKRNNQTYKNM